MTRRHLDFPPTASELATILDRLQQVQRVPQNSIKLPVDELANLIFGYVNHTRNSRDLLWDLVDRLEKNLMAQPTRTNLKRMFIDKNGSVGAFPPWDDVLKDSRIGDSLSLDDDDEHAANCCEHECFLELAACSIVNGNRRPDMPCDCEE